MLLFFWYRELLTKQVEASFITNKYFTAVDRVRRVQLRRQVFVTRVVTVMDLLSFRAFQERTTRSMDLTPLKIVFLVHQVEVIITQSCSVSISVSIFIISVKLKLRFSFLDIYSNSTYLTILQNKYN